MNRNIELSIRGGPISGRLLIKQNKLVHNLYVRDRYYLQREKTIPAIDIVPYGGEWLERYRLRKTASPLMRNFMKKVEIRRKRRTFYGGNKGKKNEKVVKHSPYRFKSDLCKDFRKVLL